MGGIVIDGYAFLRFKGPIRGFKKAMLAIDTVPLPEKVKIAFVPLPDENTPYRAQGFTVQMMVNGIPLREFGETLTKLEIARQKLKDMGIWIDGPAPKIEEGLSTWVITIRHEP